MRATYIVQIRGDEEGARWEKELGGSDDTDAFALSVMYSLHRRATRTFSNNEPRLSRRRAVTPGNDRGNRGRQQPRTATELPQ
ncbi:hypothetical protein MRX96_015616 [Rhipicephalus microplus]